jgi:two-component system, OmpR family, response regulator
MRILLIEDDRNIQEFLKAALESENYIVDAIDDGEKGSYAARTNEYDIIILDLALPKKDGHTICTEIRKAGKIVPILMLTVIGDIQEKVKLLNSGADDYLTKPFSFKELLARIRALMRRPHRIDSDIIEVGDLTIDTARQKVLRNNKEIYLTRKEFSLLEYLMRHRGNVVSRGMIMEHVWNADSDPFSNTIEAHILNIRKKVDTLKTCKLIHTMPGRGYKIESV